MKILYAVQATGNGHIARAIELMPYFEQYGTVDVFLSGSNSSLAADLPVCFKSKGISLHYTSNGGLDYIRMLKNFSARRVWNEAKNLPVEKYDCVINDFESIAALSCRIKKVPSIGFGHQASFQSLKSVRPEKKSFSGEWVLRKYAPSTMYAGLHFKQYDSFIFNPVIKKTILNAQPKNKQHITVYLPQYSDELLLKYLTPVDAKFHLFSKKARNPSHCKNVKIIPVNNDIFNENMINCEGVITGAGFETPAEVLYLEKKLLCIPIKGQYEQKCNAEALKDFNVMILEDVGKNFSSQIMHWLHKPKPKPIRLKYSTEEIVEEVMCKAEQLYVKTKT